jgi:glycosyltransferase involved in cell wall biosynthesis
VLAEDCGHAIGPGELERPGGLIEANLMNIQDNHSTALEQWLRKSEYKILHILHNRPITERKNDMPGGTEHHVADLIRSIPTAAHWSLYPTEGEYCLTAHIPDGERKYYISADELDLNSLVNPGLFDVVHVHHINNFDQIKLADALLRHGRYFVSVHDFRMCCPRVNLFTPEGRLCNGRECVASCRQKQGEIETLRATTKRIFENAQAVICFSESTKDRFTTILGGEFPWTTIEHGIDLPKPVDKTIPVAEDCPKPSLAVPLKVAFLGSIGLNKGAFLIREIVKTHKLPMGVPIEWHLIGSCDVELDSSVIRHGRYDRRELQEIMGSVSPHVAAILSICPESYCFTFDEALACGIPVISTPLGAPAERLRRYRCGWISEKLSVEGFLETLGHVVEDWDEYREIRKRIPDIQLNSVQESVKGHERIYRVACEGGQVADSAQLPIFVARLRTIHYRHYSRPRWLMRFCMNAGYTVLDGIKVISSARWIAKRVLPKSLRNRINELRQSEF